MLKRVSQSPLATRHSKSSHRYQNKKKETKEHTIHNEDKLKVFIKFKPINRSESENTEQIKYIDDKSIEIKTAIKNKIYHFDYVFDGYQNHQHVFQKGCKQLIDNVFIQTYEQNQVNHGLIFVYGNTGTGKTYSMGLLNAINIKSQGIVPDSLKHVFDMKRKKCFEPFNISISFCEIYLDEIYDLLDFQSEAKLTIRQDSKSRQPYIQNQTAIEVKTVEQAFEIINIGLEKRRVAEQKMNRKSSRGHGLITINIIPSGNEKPGKVCFIDLAGCERLKDSQSKGSVLTEALHINSSLSSLQTLLMNISDQNMRNYRASKLTRILQPFIESGRINLFVTTNYENINAIEFAKRCKGIRFLEKQIKVSTTPTKRSKVTENQSSKMAKELQQLYLFKKQAIDKEKKYISTITNLINIINKMAYEIEHVFKNQTLHSHYSFSQIINNAELEKRINQKIKEYESKEADIVEKVIEKMDRNDGYQLDFSELIKDICNPNDFMRSVCENTQEIIHNLKQLGKYSQSKNIYKKEYFTSELKVNLLENKCKKYEQSIYYFMKYMNTTDKRVIRRLKELNISTNKENIQNIPHLKNKRMPTRSIEKSQCIVREFVNDEPEIFDNSERRSAIFIDEI